MNGKVTIFSSVLISGVASGALTFESSESVSTAANDGTTFRWGTDLIPRTEEDMGSVSAQASFGSLPIYSTISRASTSNDQLKSYSRAGDAILNMTADGSATITQVYQVLHLGAPLTISLDVDMRLDGMLRAVGSLTARAEAQVRYGLNIIRGDGTFSEVLEFTGNLNTAGGFIVPFGTSDAANFSSAWSTANPSATIFTASVDFSETYEDLITVNNGECFALQWYVDTRAYANHLPGNYAYADFENTAYIGVSTNDPGATLNFIGAVPEPSSGVFALIGLMGLMKRRR